MNWFGFAARAGFASFALLFISQSAFGQGQSNIARCLSIQNVNKRVDCLEGGGISRDTAQPANRSNISRVLPSFDCREAAHSIERAICGDPTLSEWDARMAQQYQQTLTARRSGEAQAFVESQRLWIQQRNNACGAVDGAAVSPCAMDMTRQRIAALSDAPQKSEGAPATPIPLPPQQQYPAPAVPKNQGAPSLSQPPAAQATPMPSATSNSNASSSNSTSGGLNPVLLILFVIGALLGGIAVFKNIQHRARCQSLIAKYGEQIADLILTRQVQQGMTAEQVIESRGDPTDSDREIRKAKTKETWKYGQIGKNRFSHRVYLEDGIVIGFKD